MAHVSARVVSSLSYTTFRPIGRLQVYLPLPMVSLNHLGATNQSNRTYPGCIGYNAHVHNVIEHEGRGTYTPGKGGLTIT